MKRATIKDVAASAEVSPATVSRVFSGEASVSDAIVKRVRDAADKLGYRPSVMARSLTSSHTNLIALVVGSLRNPFDAQLAEELSSKFFARGKRLLVVPADDGGNDPATAVAQDYQADGIIVAAGLVSQEAGERFANLGMPIVLFGRVMEASGVDCIVADNMAGGRQAGELLARSKSKRVAYLRHVRETFSDDERYQGLLAGLGEGAEVDVYRSSVKTARDDALQFLSGDDRPDAIFAANDVLAFGVLEAAALMGLRVPEDLKVVGFDDIPNAASPFYNLTTLRQRADVIADWIVNRLQARLDNPELTVTVERVPLQMVVRGSTYSSNSLSSNTIAAFTTETDQ